MEWEYLYNEYSFDIKIISKEAFKKECPFCKGDFIREGDFWHGWWWGESWYDEANRLTFEYTGRVYKCLDCGKYFAVED